MEENKSSKHQTVENIAVVVGRNKNVNCGEKIKENIEMSKFRKSRKPA